MGRAIKAASHKDDDKTAAEKFLEACKNLCKICEIPTLEEFGIDKEKFFEAMDKMADDAIASGSPANTIKDVTKEDILRIYAKLWN